MVKYRKLVDKYRKNAVLGGRQGEEWGKEGGVRIIEIPFPPSPQPFVSGFTVLRPDVLSGTRWGYSLC